MTNDLLIKTWADGYGTWHAQVSHCDEPDRAYHAARDAIRQELAERNGPNFAPHVIAVKLRERDGTTSHYVETNTNEGFTYWPISPSPMSNVTRWAIGKNGPRIIAQCDEESAVLVVDALNEVGAK